MSSTREQNGLFRPERPETSPVPCRVELGHGRTSGRECQSMLRRALLCLHAPASQLWIEEEAGGQEWSVFQLSQILGNRKRKVEEEHWQCITVALGPANFGTPARPFWGFRLLGRSGSIVQRRMP